jgi:benzoyl-CoA reductase subunit C
MDYSYYLPMPHHVQSPHATPFLTKELEAFRASLEEWLGRKIENKAIEEAIEVYNRNRELMWRVYELRKGKNPPLTGEEAMEMVLSAQMVDKAEHNAALETLLGRLSERKVARQAGTRLMILGSEDDDVEFLNMVESCGATFVTDDHCTGTRYFWNNVESNGDLLTRIADRYVKRVPCPTKDWPERTRVAHAIKHAKDYGVQGAIIMQQKFCDPHELDTPSASRRFSRCSREKTCFEPPAQETQSRWQPRRSTRRLRCGAGRRPRSCARNTTRITPRRMSAAVCVGPAEPGASAPSRPDWAGTSGA